MLLAGIDIIRQFLYVLHKASHGSSHEFREIVSFQVRCLVRNVRISRTMRFIKAIARKVYEQVKYFVRNGLFYTIIYGTMNKGFALRL